MMKMKNIKAIFRRGPSQASSKSEHGQVQGQIRDDLSRSSSVTNLNAEHKNKGAFSKLRKSASKDKLDKLAEKKNDKKGIPSNNNKLDSGEVDHFPESLQEIELLQRQLTDMAKEKSDLALELGERKGELQILKNEIVKLKMFQDQSTVRIEQLNDENTSLRNRLRDVAHSPLSDNEKQQLLDSHRHSSAPASIATNLLEDGNVGDITACPTPDWDKHSSSNVSEVSVACLQDKINQMQETHYSTNEELQATLQELTDLQRQLTELQQDNERLLDEKNLMFDSLCRQTERLNDARAEVESLKQLLYRDKDETGQLESIVDREQKLVDLLKSAQEERETLLVKQEQLNNELQDARTANKEQMAEIEQLTERVRTLESTLDAKHAEHRQLDQELAIAKDQCSGRQIEINRLTDLLENARTKINELEQERALNDKSELDELLDNARKEKDALESEVANLKEQVARSRNETEKLREQVSILQEECKVTRNNAKCTQSELEYKCEKLTLDKTNLNEQLMQLQEAANELQVQAQCQLEDKRQLSSVLSETQRNLSEAERKNNELGTEVEELKRLRKEENEEWEKFQNDLLTSVRVANDFKSEAQQELQKMIMENKAHRERVRQLEAQLDKLKGDVKNTGPDSCSSSQTMEPHLTDTALPLNILTQSQNAVEETHSLDSDIKAETATKNSSKFPSIISRKSETKPATEKSDNSTGNALRYADSSKIINSSQKLSVKSQSESNIVKKRTKSSKKYPEKRLSDQEARNLEILSNLHSQIDPNTPEDQLTEEQKFIVKLKKVYDSDEGNLKTKPVAKKPKDKLAISKPLLDSVLDNPRLKEITEDRRMVQVETDAYNDDPYSLEFKEFVASDPTFSKRYEMIMKPESKFTDVFQSNIEFNYYNEEVRPKSVSSFKPDTLHPKSKSLDDIYYRNSISNDDENVFGASSSVTDDDATEAFPCKNITFETLDELYAKIDLSIPEDQLTKEQKFVLRLKKSLDDMGRKRTLQKRRATKHRKKIQISEPTETSILTNPKLVSIINDPQIKPVEAYNRFSQISSTSSVQVYEVEDETNHDDLGFKKSMSYDDINVKDILNEHFEFKLPRVKLIASTPDVSEDNARPKYVKHQGEHAKRETAPFYRVKRAYDLQVLRPSVDKRKISLNEPESDSEAICILGKSVKSESDDDSQSEDKHDSALGTIQESSEGGVVVRTRTTSMASSLEEDEEIMSSLKSRLDEDELDLVQKIQSSADYSRPDSGLNEEDLKVIALAQRQCSLVDDGDENDLKENNLEVKLNDNEDAKNSLKTKLDSDEMDLVQEIHAELNRKQDGLRIVCLEDYNHEDQPDRRLAVEENNFKSKLNDDELDLVQRIQSSSDYIRPDSGLNEEDMQIIALAQQQCSEDEENQPVANLNENLNLVDSENEDKLEVERDTNEESLNAKTDAKDEVSFSNKTRLKEEDLTTLGTRSLQDKTVDDKVALKSDESELKQKVSDENIVKKKLVPSRLDADTEKPAPDETVDDKVAAISDELELKQKVSDENILNKKLVCSRLDADADKPAPEESIQKLGNDVLKSEKDSEVQLRSQEDSPLTFVQFFNKARSSTDAEQESSYSQKIHSKPREPIYVNYATFLNQMIHQEEKEACLVAKKQPLPLPRTKSVDEIVDTSISQSNSDSAVICDSTPTSPIDIFKITRDISALTSSLEDLDRNDEDMITSPKNTIDSSSSSSVKVFVNKETHYPIIGEDAEQQQVAESCSNDKTTGYVSKDKVKVFGNVEKYKALEFMKNLEEKIGEEAEVELAKSAVKFFDSEAKENEANVDVLENLPEGSDKESSAEDKHEQAAITVQNLYEIQFNSPLESVPEAKQKENDKIVQTVQEDESENLPKVETTDQKQSVSTQSKNTVILESLPKVETTDQKQSVSTQSKNTVILESLPKEKTADEKQSFSTQTDYDGNEEILNDEKAKQDNLDTSNTTTTGFSIYGVFNKLGHIIHAVTTSVTTSTKDIITQTEPVIVEHHFRSHSKKKREKHQKETKNNYDSLDRHATFHVLNNPPVDTPKKLCQHVPRCPHHCYLTPLELPDFKPAPSYAHHRSSIGEAIQKYESLIQANQHQMDFKSETMRATFGRLRRVNAEFVVGTQTEKQDLQVLEDASAQVPAEDD